MVSDNQNVVHILQAGSRKPDLQKEALAIFYAALSGQIRIKPEWIPRTQNEQADALNYIIDYDDWGLTLYFLQDWTPFEVRTP